MRPTLCAAPHHRHPGRRAGRLRDSTDPDSGRAADGVAPRGPYRRPYQPNPSEEAIVSTILIGVDASARSEDAVAFGRRLAHRLRRARRPGLRVPVRADARPSHDSELRYDLRAKARSDRRRGMREGLRDVPDDRVEIRARRPLLARPRPARPRRGRARRARRRRLDAHRPRSAASCPGATAERLLHGVALRRRGRAERLPHPARRAAPPRSASPPTAPPSPRPPSRPRRTWRARSGAQPRRDRRRCRPSPTPRRR